MSRPRIPAPLARRLDRLARRAHAFHRFAHHPLCERYAGEVVWLGRRTRVCRGCALAFAGLAAGGAAGAVLPAPPARLLLLAVALAAPTLLAAVLPRGGALPKLLTRAAPGALTAVIAALGLRSSGAAGTAASAAGLLLAALALIRYRRRGPDRRACLGCPEQTLPRACSGLRPIVQREAAFGRLAGRVLAAARRDGRAG